MKAIASLSLLFFGFCTFTTGGEKKKSDSMQKFQGTWTLVEARLGDSALRLDKPPLQLRITQEKIIVIEDGKERKDEWTCKADPTREPNAIDIIHKDTHTKAIYKFEGNRMKIACVCFGETRPASFDEKGLLSVVLERVKE
jgi:uncharacterized protein (TIGR03067 family)